MYYTMVKYRRSFLLVVSALLSKENTSEPIRIPRLVGGVQSVDWPNFCD